MPVWITLDVGLPKHPKIAELSGDAARFGWIVTLCEAKSQRTPGAFSSERHYREVVGRYAKYLTEYLAARLLERHEDGTLFVHDWERHQWSVRQARHRGDGSVTEALSQGDPSRAVSVPVSFSTSTEGGAGGDRDSLDRYHELTEFRPWAQWSGKALLRAEADYGRATVMAALDAENAAGAGRDELLKRTLARIARDSDKARQAQADQPKPERIPRDEAAYQAARIQVDREARGLT